MKKDTVVKPRSKRSCHDLSCQSLTTTDLFKIKPVFSRLTIPNDHFNIKSSQINRVDSLPVSSFVEIKNRLAWFHVKNVQVWKPWDSFITQAPYAFGGLNTVPSEVPYITPLDFSSLFRPSNNFGLATSTTVTSSIQDVPDAYHFFDSNSYDKLFVTLNTDGTIYSASAYSFTVKGRLIYDILYSLGYRFPDIVIIGTSQYSAQTLDYAGVHMSLLPLMAYLSVLVNYYVPVKFRSFAFVNSFSYLVSPYNSHVSSFIGTISDPDIVSFWSNVFEILSEVYYGSDYFTDSLASSPYRTFSTGGINTTPGDSTSNGFTTIDSGTIPPQAVIGLNDDNNPYLTQYIISALQAVTSKSQLAALTNNDIVGRALAMFGYKPEVADMVPALLSHKNSNIYVSPEVAQADTYDSNTGEGTPLGYKAGRGEGMIQDYQCNFDFDDYGQLLCISSISPDIMYTYGLHREMMHTSRGLCFDPAYVNLGPQAIANVELPNQFMFESADGMYSLLPRNTFGFQNRFAELGYRRDFMSGDFVMKSRNNNLNAFHFSRKITVDQCINTKIFALGRYAAVDSPFGIGQYDRIFFDQTSQNDHIQQWNIFEIKADRDIPYNGEMSVGDDNNGKEQEVGRHSEVLNA